VSEELEIEAVEDVIACGSNIPSELDWAGLGGSGRMEFSSFSFNKLSEVDDWLEDGLCVGWRAGELEGLALGPVDCLAGVCDGLALGPEDWLVVVVDDETREAEERMEERLDEAVDEPLLDGLNLDGGVVGGPVGLALLVCVSGCSTGSSFFHRYAQEKGDERSGDIWLSVLIKKVVMTLDRTAKVLLL
jgi:hypothetical protein